LPPAKAEIRTPSISFPLPLVTEKINFGDKFSRNARATEERNKLHLGARRGGIKNQFANLPLARGDGDFQRTGSLLKLLNHIRARYKS
jgi:hypothetical protein